MTSIKLVSDSKSIFYLFFSFQVLWLLTYKQVEKKQGRSQIMLSKAEQSQAKPNHTRYKVFKGKKKKKTNFRLPKNCKLSNFQIWRE